MRFIYTFFDTVGSRLLKAITKLPTPIMLVLIVFILTPILLIAGIADYLGKESKDVL